MSEGRIEGREGLEMRSAREGTIIVGLLGRRQ